MKVPMRRICSRLHTLPHLPVTGLCAVCLAALAAITPSGAVAQAASAPPSAATAPAPTAGTAASPAQAPETAEAASPATPPADATAPQDTGSEAAVGGGTPATGDGGTAPREPEAVPSPAQPPTPGATASGDTGSTSAPANPPPDTASAPAAGRTQRLESGAPVPPDSAERRAKDPYDGVSAGMTAAKLLIVDVREVFRSPEHWHRGEWALFGAEVAAVVTVGAFDESLQRDVRRSRSTTEDKLAKDFRTFGNYGSFEVLGGFYLAGLIVSDKKAQETCLDGLFASGIAGGLVSPFLKVVVGRNRPNANKGAYSFHPFGIHQVSFPSGEATQAFAVASVISTQYPNPLVEFISYATAAITAWGRVRQNGHWASDSLAGAFIGFHIGRRVVHINQRLRARVTAGPWVGPGGARGMKLSASF
jgi:PAP2 superfamily